jgi:NAD(P)H dehydrogenase (quinone)
MRSADARVLVVYCHPNPKSFTHAVLESVCAGLTAGGCAYEVIDLHAERFDPVLIVDETRRRRDLGTVEETRRHRELVAAAKTLVFVYPVWWGGFPAMLKGFIDRVFVSGLTYSFQHRPKDAHENGPAWRSTAFAGGWWCSAATQDSRWVTPGSGTASCGSSESHRRRHRPDVAPPWPSTKPEGG